MARSDVVCDECGTLLYCDPSPVTDAADVTPKTQRLTKEQCTGLGIVCSSDKCSPKPIVLVPAETLESVEQEMLSGGEFPPQEQQEQDLEGKLERELGLLDSLPQVIDGKPVYTGENPCRRCYNKGYRCSWEEGSDSCSACVRHNDPCRKSLVGIKPAAVWQKWTVVDYSSPCIVHASRLRSRMYGNEVLEYQVKWIFKTGHCCWEEAETMKKYPWILKKFHHDNPNMPGPPEWLAAEEDDDFFYGDSDELTM